MEQGRVIETPAPPLALKAYRMSVTRQDTMRIEVRAWRWFIGAWVLLTLVKLVVAARLPLFVDEAFYWQEGQHLAWAYSDLPGLTAWLTRIGVGIGGNNPLALRAPFLLIAAWWRASPHANSAQRMAGSPPCAPCCSRSPARSACSRSRTRR
jgi:hypothetical protein